MTAMLQRYMLLETRHTSMAADDDPADETISRDEGLSPAYLQVPQKCPISAGKRALYIQANSITKEPCKQEKSPVPQAKEPCKRLLALECCIQRMSASNTCNVCNV